MTEATLEAVQAPTDSHPEPAASVLLDVSVIIVSFNTKDVLRQCLRSVREEAGHLRAEILVVDNASADGSAEMIEHEFPEVRLLRSRVNLGFGAANNLALEQARGNFFVLLNSDAFVAPGALLRAIRHMEETPSCGLGGARLVGRDGSSQPSARRFHSVLDDAMVLTGLAARFPRSKLFGRFDRTWADESVSATVDWVPGAFAIIRPAALRRAGLFDPAFFLYYEEVDLCLRMKRAGFEVWYWPDLVVTHLGGESSRQIATHDFSESAAQVELWRMRSTFLYFRKHHGAQVHGAMLLEKTLLSLRILRNRFSSEPWRRKRARRSRKTLALLEQAWKDTGGGRVSPPRPW